MTGTPAAASQPANAGQPRPDEGPSAAPAVGDVIELSIERVAHGGHCVGRLDGRAVFVRHATPGERVTARVTAVGKRGRFLNADVVDVLEASEHRVAAPCEYAGVCGGCDFQHIDLAYQRELKSEVLRESLARFSGLSDQRLDALDLAVHPLTSDAPEGQGAHPGLGWRRRLRMIALDDGALGFRRHGEDSVVEIESCPVATDAINEVIAERRDEPHGQQVGTEWALVDPDGRPAGIWAADAGTPRLPREAAGTTFGVGPRGFWQAHRDAPDALVDVVLGFCAPRPGGWAWDLYSGAGLFSVPLARALGVTGRVDAVEGDPDAVRAARRAGHDLPQLRIHEAPVSRWLAAGPDADGETGGTAGRLDVVVLDPPRRGARREVVEAIAAAAPERIVYVACDPVALARDVGTLRSLGYAVSAIRAMDAFPMTGQFEAVALLTREAQ